jgi:citrate lyase subunit alpha/citrate CoA-transferase
MRIFAGSICISHVAYLLKYLENGTISHIKGSMNRPLGRYCSEGKMSKTLCCGHGGRFQAIRIGMLKLTLL